MVFVDRRDAGRRLAARGRRATGDRAAARGRAGGRRDRPGARRPAGGADRPQARRAAEPGARASARSPRTGPPWSTPRRRAALGVTQADLERILARELRELRRRMERFRDGRPPVDVAGRTVIVVDDGAGHRPERPGGRARAAARGARRGSSSPCRSARARRWRMLGAGGRRGRLPTRSRASCVGVGRWYGDFSPVSDEEVLALLGEAARPPAPPSRPPAPTGGDARAEFDVGGGPPAPGDLTLPAGRAGPGDVRPRQRQQPPQPAQPRRWRAALNEAGLATLLFDLLTEEESGRRELVFDIPLLAGRLVAVTRWAPSEPGDARAADRLLRRLDRRGGRAAGGGRRSARPCARSSRAAAGRTSPATRLAAGAGRRPC